MYWQVVTDRLQADERIEVSLFESLEELSGGNTDTQVDVSIIPWSHKSDGHPWRHRIGTPACRAVIGVDDSTNEALLWTQKIDYETLLSLSRVLSGMRLVVGGSIGGETSVVELHPFQAELQQTLHEDGPLRHLLAWARLVMRKWLADWPDEGPSGQIPGWTTDLSHVRELMGAKRNESSSSVRTKLKRIWRDIEPKGLLPLGARLPLSELEQRILALALAPEIDGRFHAAYGYVHNDMTRCYASATLLANLLAEPGVDALAIHRAVFDDGLIARLRLLQAESGPDGRIGPESTLRVAGDLVEHMTRGHVSPISLAPVLGIATHTVMPFLMTDAASELRAALELPAASSPQLIQLVGQRSSADWATTVLGAAGHCVLKVDVDKQDDLRFSALDRLAAKIARVSRLTNAIPILHGTRQNEGSAHELAILLLRCQSTVVVDLAQPTSPPASVMSRIIDPFAGSTIASAKTWQAAAQAFGISISGPDARELAATRRDDESQVISVCRHVAAAMPGRTSADIAQIRAIATSINAPQYPALIRRISPAFTWDDIVLDGDRLGQLREIPMHVRRAALVMDEWGYASRLPYGQGVAALFAGPSGTGKTMAAQIIAADLGVEVFQVDLAKTVSKYIGETEKHLDNAFEDAERASAVLLFDEADALFGKRTEVKDAHDRHANVEVAYLLQRLEQFRGLVILTTNFRQNLDAAFVRRLRFSCDFPNPGADERLEIWKRAFPPNTPVARDLDLEFLARRFKLTGGNIQQIALMAAFLATEHGRVEMSHISSASHQVFAKLGMVSAQKSLVEATAPPDESLTA